jgi:acylphosphatase
MPVIHLMVVGKVQGVGFRWFVREMATELELSGWVRNTPDGDVELVASGDEATLEQLASAVGRGPVGARVTEVRQLAAADGDVYPSPFRIER